ncbi:hypothetical protein BG000_002469 [Podila horticola]|nr:hypothetical protein BG000_002469 [Podila horticola]
MLASTNSPPTVLDLPSEVLDIVLDDLARDDLTKCARVCKIWYHASMQFIWRGLDPGFFSFLTDGTLTRQQILRKSAPLVREVALHNAAVLPYLFACKYQQSLPKERLLWADFHKILDLKSVVLTKLSKLHILYPLEGEIKTSVAKALIQNTPHLTSLIIHTRSSPSPNTMLALTRARDTLEVFWLLVAISPRFAKQILYYLPESIRFVHLNINAELESQGETSVDEDITQDHAIERRHSLRGRATITSASLPRSHPQVEYLWLKGDFRGYEEELLLPFLATCGATFKKFQADETDCFRSKALHTALVKAGASLWGLKPHHLPLCERSTDSDIAKTIDQHTMVYDLELNGCEAAGPLTIEAIVRCGERLCVLQLRGCSGLSSKNLMSILHATRGNLRLFSTVSSPVLPGDASDPFILAQDLIAATTVEWMVPSLLFFHCQIRVPRLDHHVPAEAVDATWGHPTAEQCHDIQKAVLRQIALQTSLTSLALGSILGRGWDNTRPCQWYSLEMSLQSGLDELASLKDLRELDVGLINHRIGIVELEWMSANWPNLKCIYEFFHEGQDRDPDVVAWLVISQRGLGCRGKDGGYISH